jgi:hypothetical protein
MTHAATRLPSRTDIYQHTSSCVPRESFMVMNSPVNHMYDIIAETVDTTLKQGLESRP